MATSANGMATSDLGFEKIEAVWDYFDRKKLEKQLSTTEKL